MIEPRILKGFRDFLPKNVKKRQYVLNTLKKVFESYGFKPLETPTIEYEEILTGKYGEEEKLMYKFEDNGGRKVALRYDQTVPLARVIAQYQNEIKYPFKRYQIQNVFRAENTQKGRYREFLQVDADIIGSSSLLSDTEIIEITIKCLKELGFKNFKVLINDRENFIQFSTDTIRALDKIDKIDEAEVINVLMEKNNWDIKEANKFLEDTKKLKPNKKLQEIINKFDEIIFKPTLARGLDYYTGMIFETKIEGYNAGSVAGGGRYDNLIGIFTNKQIPAVGFSFGFDRLIEAMEELNLFPNNLQTTKALVTLPSLEKENKSLEIAAKLRKENINTEIYLGDNLDLEKQLKYADNKEIPYVVIINDKLILKDMQKRTQEELNLSEIVDKLG